jgi:hypothetical protein
MTTIAPRTNNTILSAISSVLAIINTLCL